MAAERVVSPVLIGRDEALAALSASLRAARAQGPAVALVAGEAGIGKSRLLAEFVRALDPGVRAVEGVCAELGGDGLVYAPFVAVVRRLIRGGAVAPAGRYRELARWFPELGPGPLLPGTAAGGEDDGGGDDGGGGVDGGGGKHRLYEELLSLIEEAAENGPLVLAIEDLHWADAATRELFGFLARNLTRGARVLLLATYRPAEAIDGRLGPLGPLLSELVRRPHTATLRLGRLSEREVGHQLAAILGTEPDLAAVRRVHRRSDGNPLFVEALARAGERTPDSLRDLLLHGPRSLPDSALRLLRTASVAGGRIEHRLLEEVAEPEGAELDALLRVLVGRSLLVTAASGYDFRHALIRQAVYEDLLPGERTRLHARYAEALSRTGSPADLAVHAYAAGDHGQALVAAFHAAGLAYRSYAYEEQVRMLERVLDLWDRVPGPDSDPDPAHAPDLRTRLGGADRVDVLTAAAEASMLTGDYARGIDFADAGLAAVDERSEPERAAQLLEHRGRLRIRLNGSGDSDFEHALELLPDTPDHVQRGRLFGMMAMGRLPNTEEARRPFTEALRIGRRTGDATVTVRGLLGVGAMRGDLAMLAEARTLAERLDSPDLLLTVPMYEATLHTKAGEQRRSVEAARDGIRRARRFGLARSRGAELARYAARSLILAGRWDEASVVLAEALDEDPPPVPRRALRILAGRLALLRGDVDAAAEAAAQAAGQNEDPERVEAQAGTSLFPRHELYCLLALAQGDPEQADRSLARALADPALFRNYSSDARPVLLAGELVQRARLARARAGDAPLRERVAARRAELIATDDALGVDGPLDRAVRATFRALLDDGEEDGEEYGEEYGRWDVAIAAWRELEHPYELARSLFHGARAALAAGERATGTARLKEAARLAADLGAAPLAREIALLDTPAGAALQHGLTARERDVLPLIAQGLSNRQIADRLHISPSTAGVHVSHILTKLGATTRTEAAAIAFRSGLADG